MRPIVCVLVTCSADLSCITVLSQTTSNKRRQPLKLAIDPDAAGC